MVALNSNCEYVGGCDASSPMVRWLEQDLAANPKMKPTWDALYAAGADVVVSGHDHHYERFALQTPSGGQTRSGA